jgi:hypothetical protein
VEQLSVAEGGVHVTTASHEDELVVVVMSEGHPEMTGAVTSLTITLKLQVEMLPDPSVKV